MLHFEVPISNHAATRTRPLKSRPDRLLVRLVSSSPQDATLSGPRVEVNGCTLAAPYSAGRPHRWEKCGSLGGRRYCAIIRCTADPRPPQTADAPLHGSQNPLRRRFLTLPHWRTGRHSVRQRDDALAPVPRGTKFVEAFVGCEPVLGDEANDDAACTRRRTQPSQHRRRRKVAESPSMKISVKPLARSHASSALAAASSLLA
jgi:hypothetical protein